MPGDTPVPWEESEGTSEAQLGDLGALRGIRMRAAVEGEGSIAAGGSAAAAAQQRPLTRPQM
ncbi:MAG: hypothetical protein U0R52_09740 [Solirubrobacterales bacterium]